KPFQDLSTVALLRIGLVIQNYTRRGATVFAFLSYPNSPRFRRFHQASTGASPAPQKSNKPHSKSNGRLFLGRGTRSKYFAYEFTRNAKARFHRGKLGGAILVVALHKPIVYRAAIIA
ncbi:MAG: hypothetical protein NT013_03245, partial [Planctomycetia bacterium]|nr:hypothetical protein [Planctomycetia bacterium]